MRADWLVPPCLIADTPPEDILNGNNVTNSCAAGRKLPHTKKQSKQIHDKSPGDGVYGQTMKEITG